MQKLLQQARPLLLQTNTPLLLMKELKFAANQHHLKFYKFKAHAQQPVTEKIWIAVLFLLTLEIRFYKLIIKKQ